MGHIVRLGFVCSDPRKLKLLVCALPFFSEYDPDNREFYYRGRENKERGDEMPDAFIKIDNAGVEFCAYGANEVVSVLYAELKKRIQLSFGGYEEKL